jgi:purine-binding chemotaxis protein CheW
LLSRNGGLSEIQSICRLNGGKRLVSILSSEKMFNTGEIRAVIEHGEAEDAAMRDTANGAQSDVIDDEQQFVIFRLMNEEYGVPISSVQEIVRVPEELTRVPKTPDFVEGVVNVVSCCQWSTSAAASACRRWSATTVSGSWSTRSMVSAPASSSTRFWR